MLYIVLIIYLVVNDQLHIELHDLNYRESTDIQIHGVHYSTFFGGSDITWAPLVDETAYFRNFKMGAYSTSTSPSRMDVNECSTGQHTCSVSASCVNNLGGFDCICNEGFEGNGFDCDAGKVILTPLTNDINKYK